MRSWRRTALTAVLVSVGWHGASASENRPVRSLYEYRTDQTIIQEWDNSCGAAALAMLLKFQHGEAVGERDIALEMIGREEYLKNPSLVRYRRGFSLFDMKRVANRYGYDGIGLGNLTFEDLSEQAPIIVPLSLKGFDHFVVFLGAVNDRVLVADPSYGKRTLRRADFLRDWMKFSDLGRVGFRVARRDGLIPPNRLVPTAADFLTFN